MRRSGQEERIRTWLLLLCITVCIASYGPTEVEASGKGSEGLHGRVVDSVTGAGIPGARIEVEGMGAVVVTGEDGHFRLQRDVEPGKYLLVHAVGYADLRIAVERSPRDGSGPIRIGLEPEPMRYREEIIVTATRTPTRISDVPGNVTVLRGEDLDSSPSANLADTLASTTGIHSYSAWGNPMDFGVDARGFTANGTSSYLLVLLDGQPLNDLDTGVVEWNMVPMERIERVEIQRGPASALYGDLGLGGVVHLFSGSRPDAPSASFSLQAGSYGERQGRFTYGSRSGRLTYDVFASDRALDGYRDRSDWSGSSLAGRIALEIDPVSRLQVSTMNSWIDNTSPGPLNEEQLSLDRTQAGYPFDGWDQRRNSISIEYRREAESGSTLALDLHHRMLDSDRIQTLPLELQIGDFLMPVFDVKRQRLDSRLSVLQAQMGKPLTWKGGNHLLVSGFEASSGRLDSLYRILDEAGAPGPAQADGSGTRKVFSAYLQDQITTGGSLRWLFGIRYDRFEDRFHERIAQQQNVKSGNDAFSPKAGVTWSYGADGDLFLQITRGYRAPTMEQLFDQRLPFDVTLSNESLEPQRAWSYEVGVRQALPGFFDLEASLYWMKVKNEIEFDPATFRYGNVGRSLHKGLELSVKRQIGARANLFASYALQEATYETPEHDGMQISSVPRHLGSLRFRYGGSRGWTGNLAVRIVGRQFLDESNQYALASYSTVDARLGYVWNRLEAFITCRNLLDEKYSSSAFLNPRMVIAPGPDLALTVLSYPSPERSYLAGIRWNWAAGE